MHRALRHFAIPNLLALGLLAGCSASADKAQLPPRSVEGANVAVQVIRPTTTLESDRVRATGKLVARHEAILSPKVGGPISKFYVDVGSDVKKGDPLLEIDATAAALGVEQAQAALAVAEAAYEVARQDLERARTLSTTGGVSPAGLEKAEAAYKQTEANVKQARAALRNAQRYLADHTLRAPFDGRITARLKNLGEYVAMAPSTPVLGLVDSDSLEVVLPVPETVVAAVRPGATVRGVVNPTNTPFEAKVRTVSTVVDPTSRTVEVRADLVGERTEAMRPNAIVEVHFSGGTADGIFLPAGSVREEGTERFVWVVEGGKAHRRKVRAETVMPGVVRILEGIDAQTVVVAQPGSILSEGLAVRTIE